MKFPSVEVEKRDRDEHTDTLIKSLLDEEQASKKQKKSDPRLDVGATQGVPVRKGKTLAEIEAEEGGPIKESMVGMAHTKRAQNRNKRDVDVGDTDVVTNTERYEKDTLDVEQEDGITFEPFNLKQEREEGYFDEDGNYVLRKQGGEDADDEKDAWLTSEEAKVVSDAVRQKIEQERARAEAAARRGPLTERQIAQRKADMAAVMQPGETALRALKRLGAGGGAAAASTGAVVAHRAMGKRERARLLAQQQQQQQSAAAPAATASGSAPAAAWSSEALAREQFTKLTELADELLEEGELEIYSATTEELLRSARMWLPQLAAPAAAPAGAATGSARPAPAATAAAESDDEDMFGDKDDDGGDDGKKSDGAGGAAASPQAAAAAAAKAKANVAVDGDQDMFADDDGDEAGGDGAGAAGGGVAGGPAGAAAGQPPRNKKQEGEEEEAAKAASASGGVPKAGSSTGPGPAPSGAAGAGKEEEVDYGSWPIKELKRLLQERGVDPSGFVEKADLVAKVKEVVAAGGAAEDAGANDAGGGGGAFMAPPGYVFDPSSGYFFSEESGMYYDTSTGAYCQAATGKWFYLDPTSANFVEWKQG